MAKVRVVTDSTVCLPRELVKRCEIGIVLLKFIYEEMVYRDGLDISADEVVSIRSTIWPRGDECRKLSPGPTLW